jgi:hypothetical protein
MLDSNIFSNLRSKSTGCQLKIHAAEQKIARDHLNENIADTHQTEWNEILETNND